MAKFKLFYSVSLLVLLMCLLASHSHFVSAEGSRLELLQNATTKFFLTSNQSKSADLFSFNKSSSSGSTDSEIFMLIVQNEYNEETKKDGDFT